MESELKMKYNAKFGCYILTRNEQVINLFNDDIDKLVDFVIKTEETQQKREENEQRAN